MIFGRYCFWPDRLDHETVRVARPPLILGFVLGGLVERYIAISVRRYGQDWICGFGAIMEMLMLLSRPIVPFFL